MLTAEYMETEVAATNCSQLPAVAVAALGKMERAIISCSLWRVAFFLLSRGVVVDDL